MTQDYYRFEPDRTLGIICSAVCNTAAVAKGKYAASGALESVYLWNVRTGELERRLTDGLNTAEAVFIVESPTDSDILAVGIWNHRQGSLNLVFNGHKNCITALAFDVSGTRLASGARDCDIVVWDLVGETGLFRLRGHSNAIRGLYFSASGSSLISGSKDTLLKVWDLSTQHCVETVVLHHSEVTAIAMTSDRRTLMTVCADRNVCIFSFEESNVATKITKGAVSSEELKALDLVETVTRSSGERATWMTVDEDCRYLAVLGADKSLEVWRIQSKENPQRKPTGKLLKPVRYTRLQSKAVSVEFWPSWRIKTTSSIKLLAGFMDNQIGEVIVPLEPTTDISYPSAISLPGHRGECKVVSFNRDGLLFATASKLDVKVWNAMTGSMIRTVECREPSAVSFLSDETLLIGDGGGMIHLVELSSGDIVDSVKAHEGQIRAMALRSDGKGMMTGGADKEIKFWEFKNSKTSSVGKKLKTVKTLQMNDEILCLKYSPDQRYVAVATLDLTVKIFFEDTLRFYLSLYGHKLPVTGMDFSADSKTLVSVSSDKNIKIWSLEFGDCRKSIFAHQDAITFVAFLPGSKLFLTTSKDKAIKYWDAEKFTELQKITGHHGEIWGMSVDQFGSRVVTVSKDRSIRIWKTSDELLFPEEEQEKAIEEQFEKSVLEENPFEKEESKEEGGRATKKTVLSLRGGDRIMEAIQAADGERQKWDEYQQAKSKGLSMQEPTPSPLFLAIGRDKTPAEFVLFAFERIPLSEVEEALLCLPTNTLPSLLMYIQEWLRGRRNIILSARILDMVLRLFHQYIMSNPSLRVLLESICGCERETLAAIKVLIFDGS